MCVFAVCGGMCLVCACVPKECGPMHECSHLDAGMIVLTCVFHCFCAGVIVCEFTDVRVGCVGVWVCVASWVCVVFSACVIVWCVQVCMALCVCWHGLCMCACMCDLMLGFLCGCVYRVSVVCPCTFSAHSSDRGGRPLWSQQNASNTT